MNLGGVVHLNRTGMCLASVTIFILVLYLISGNGDTTSEVVASPAGGKVNMRNLLLTAIKAARNGGIEVVRVKDQLTIASKGQTKEGVNDSVTTADYLSHCAMMATLRHGFPSLRIISEEAKTTCAADQVVDFTVPVVPELQSTDLEHLADEADVTVWIDPLDATKEYTEKKYKYVTTMVCIAVAGTPIIGVVHKPFPEAHDEETSWAWSKVALSPGLQGSKRVVDQKQRFIVSISHAGQVKELIGKHFKDAEIISAAGAGYKVLEVVHGNADAYIHITAIKKWDICAGDAILRAIGGKMRTAHNSPISYNDDKNVVNDDKLIAAITNLDNYIQLF